MVFLAEVIVLCILFTVAVVPPVIRNPIGAVHDYPPAIAERAIGLMHWCWTAFGFVTANG